MTTRRLVIKLMQQGFQVIKWASRWLKFIFFFYEWSPWSVPMCRWLPRFLRLPSGLVVARRVPLRAEQRMQTLRHPFHDNAGRMPPNLRNSSGLPSARHAARQGSHFYRMLTIRIDRIFLFFLSMKFFFFSSCYYCSKRAVDAEKCTPCRVLLFGIYIESLYWQRNCISSSFS